METTVARNETRYIDTADTAKLVRAELKRNWPSIRFSVRIDRYSMGSSVNVRWTDGPTEAMVRAALEQFRGDYFDGQTDYRGGIVREANGEHVQYMGSLSCDREYSPALMQAMAARMAARYDKPAPGLKVWRSSSRKGRPVGKIVESWYYDDATDTPLDGADWSILGMIDACRKELAHTLSDNRGTILGRITVKVRDAGNIVRTY